MSARIPQLILLASASDKLCVHTIDSAQAKTSVDFQTEIQSIALSHNNLIFATCSKYDNNVSFFKGEDGQPIQKFEVVPKGSTVTDI